jgi:outer membrane biogenesis lipoprotein LolB
MWSRRLLALLFVIGCSRSLPAPPVESRATVLEAARARPIPERLTGRFSFKVRSEVLDLAGSTGGAIVLDRPGRGHLAVLGPLGGPLMTVQTDGLGVAVALMRDRRHLVAVDAEQVLRETTGGVAGIDDLLGLMAGDVPLDDAEIREQQTLEGGDLRVVLSGPQGTSLVAVLDDATATPISLEALDAQGKVVLTAAYEAFEPQGEGGPLLPTRVAMNVPLLELDLDVRYKTWTQPETVPEVFGLDTPEGFSSELLEHAVKGVAEELVRQTAGEP